MLQIPLGTVMSRLFYARKRLQALLGSGESGLVEPGAGLAADARMAKGGES